jgi:hypothetical protein
MRSRGSSSSAARIIKGSRCARASQLWSEIQYLDIEAIRQRHIEATRQRYERARSGFTFG